MKDKKMKMEQIKIYNHSTVSARELYQFLELEKAHWKRWYTKNIVKNPYAIEGEDWGGFTIMVNGNETMDFNLTLDFAKKLAMLARTKKGEEARNYFIECEKFLQEVRHNKRFEVFLKLEATKERLRQNIIDIGGTDNDFLQIDFEGRKVLFNGEPVADEELHIVLLKGRDFATELTNQRIDDNNDLESAKNLNKTHHSQVRGMIEKNMKKKPEELPTEERIKKLGE